MSETEDRRTRVPDDDWQADWEGHRKWQLTAALDSTPAERLRWLEQMLRLAQQVAQSRKSE